MKVAVIGSRGLYIANLDKYLPPETTEIISGGAQGIDTCARVYAQLHGLKLTELLPDYAKYGRAAPLVRSRAIVEAADRVLAIWDGQSRGTGYAIGYAGKRGKQMEILFAADLDRRT